MWRNCVGPYKKTSHANVTFLRILRFFYDGLWLAKRNNGEGTTSGTRLDKVIRFGFCFYALWKGEEKGPATVGYPRVELISKLY